MKKVILTEDVLNTLIRSILIESDTETIEEKNRKEFKSFYQENKSKIDSNALKKLYAILIKQPILKLKKFLAKMYYATIHFIQDYLEHGKFVKIFLGTFEGALGVSVSAVMSGTSIITAAKTFAVLFIVSYVSLTTADVIDVVKMGRTYNYKQYRNDPRYETWDDFFGRPPRNTHQKNSPAFDNTPEDQARSIYLTFDKSSTKFYSFMSNLLNGKFTRRNFNKLDAIYRRNDPIPHVAKPAAIVFDASGTRVAMITVSRKEHIAFLLIPSQKLYRSKLRYKYNEERFVTAIADAAGGMHNIDNTRS